MAISGTVVWEVRAGSSDNNGGGYKPGSSGTDWSQQASAQYTSAIGATTGAAAVIAWTGAAADMVGNILHVTGGTSAVQGFFEILSVVVGVSVTVDANVSSATTSNLAFQIGGAVGTLGKIGSSSANLGAVAGNTIWVKGSFTLTANDTLSMVGTLTSPVRVIGYGTTRGDGYLGRTNGNGPLIVTNMPTLTYNSTFRLIVSGSFFIMDCLNIVTAVSNYGTQVPVDGVLARCKVTNSSTNAAATAITVPNRGVLFNCDALLTGGSGGTAAVNVIAAAACRILANRVSGPGVGILLGASGNFLVAFNTVYGGTIPLSSNTVSSTLTVLYNTFVGGSGDGVDIITATTTLQVFLGNMVTDNGGYGFDFNNAAAAVFTVYNRTRDNTAGAINLATDWVTGTNWNAVTTDTGTSATDYTAAGSNDYSLILASPATNAGFPFSASIGALQRDQAAVAGGQKSFAFAT